MLEATRKFKSQRTKKHKRKIREKGTKPPGFSWVIHDLLAGQGRPTKLSHVNYLCEHDFKYVVSLTVNKPKALQDLPDCLKWIHIPIKDGSIPTIKQIQLFVKTVNKANKENKAIATHCAWGHGRTGVMLACYMVHWNNCKGKKAVNIIKKLRPKSFDTQDQINIVKKYAEYVYGKKQNK